MLAQIIKIEPLCTINTSFYTIKFEGRSLSEYTDFYKRLRADPGNKVELDIISSVVMEIGRHGAKDRYFNREEKNAHALPPKFRSYYIESKDFGIRLFCVVLNKHIVFLLNGDRKKTRKATEPGSNVSRYFYMANSTYEELMKGKQDKMIHWTENSDLEFDPDHLLNVKG